MWMFQKPVQMTAFAHRYGRRGARAKRTTSGKCRRFLWPARQGESHRRAMPPKATVMDLIIAGSGRRLPVPPGSQCRRHDYHQGRVGPHHGQHHTAAARIIDHQRMRPRGQGQQECAVGISKNDNGGAPDQHSGSGKGLAGLVQHLAGIRSRGHLPKIGCRISHVIPTPPWATAPSA